MVTVRLSDIEARGARDPWVGDDRRKEGLGETGCVFAMTDSRVTGLPVDA